MKRYTALSLGLLGSALVIFQATTPAANADDAAYRLPDSVTAVQLAEHSNGHGKRHGKPLKFKSAGNGQKLKLAGGGPPPWAPAHGYRRKHGGSLAGYRLPYDLDLGRCNRELLGAALGGIGGGVLGSQVGSGSGRTVAIVGGTILGVIVGGSIGETMDKLDANCVGQSLEHARDGQTIEWNSPRQDSAYKVTPTESYQRTDGRYCREYQTTATVGGQTQRTYGTACRQPDGSWELVS